MLALGGSWSGGRGNKDGEVWNVNDKQWHVKRGIDVDAFVTRTGNDFHMWLFQSPNGLVFHAGPSRVMNWINVHDNGSFTKSIVRGDRDTLNGNAVMYDIGKILTIGGAPFYTAKENQPNHATNQAHVVDINGNEATVTAAGRMHQPRALCNSVVLPNGDVVVIGGMPRGKTFSDERAIHEVEIWNPEKMSFSVGGRMKVPRTYHSIALLLQDGRIVAAGGGLCGGCAWNHPDAEIYTPPYLLNHDGSPARRPVIQDAPESMSPGQSIRVKMDTGGVHSFALVRIGAVTHAVNNDQRRIPIQNGFWIVGPSFSLNIPKNKNVLLPGSYYLFAMNKHGVPSVGKHIRYSVH